MDDPKAVIFEWLLEVSKEQPPQDIIAFNIGLFELPAGKYCVYLIGSREFSEQNGEWACIEAFAPRTKYRELPIKFDTHWGEVHRIVVQTLGEFLSSPAGLASFLSNAEAVTVGFDDGNLERVK